MKNIITTLCWMLIINASAFSQPVCGFDQANATLRKVDANFAGKLLQNETKIFDVIQQRKPGKHLRVYQEDVLTIPVVVHVLHTGDSVGTSNNPSDAQILAAIEYLNAVYSGTYPSLTPSGSDAAGDIGLRFVMARRDPDCNPTSGINRVDMSANADYVANGATNMDSDKDRAMKEPIAWDRSSYYNVYLVNKINGQDETSAQFTAGYAYFPTMNIVDGTVMLGSQMKPGSKTLVHEIGHAFSLYHTFYGSSANDKCPVGKGDMVDDTDPVSYNITPDGKVDFTCRTGNNPCINKPYNIRTESNFMSYTNCYTLFTPGQKERIKASMLLEERNSLYLSNGALAPHETPDCPPKINFDVSEIRLMKITSDVTGCAKYKDYQFNLTIGGDPLEDATVTLYVDSASDAIENGDFSFPEGNIVVFHAGSVSPASFKIRLFNNASTKTPRLLKLGFTVDAGEGIAEKGTANIFMKIVIQPADYSPVVPGEKAVADVGVFSNRIINAKIFNAALLKQKTQILYRYDELSGAGIPSSGAITGVGFFLEKKSNRPLKDVRINLAQTELTNLARDGGVQYANNMTNVLHLDTYTTIDGWNMFNFDQPFAWDGTRNIAIELCFNNGSTGTGSADIIHAYTDGSDVDAGNMIEDETIDCTKNFSLINFYLNGVKPIVIFDYSLPGNEVVSAVSESTEEYLGPYDEVFFYDTTSQRKIIAGIKNLTSWDYGCTKVRIDRAGNDAANFSYTAVGQYVARKTFFVEPQNHNDSGKYEIKLYYTGNEKRGFESATGKNWENISIIKTKVPVSSGPAEIIGRENISINTEVTLENFGNDYIVSGIFGNGLSGFTVGTVDAALPVDWLNFQVAETEGGVRLNWTTTNEQDNSFFEVQQSTDGINFTPVTILPAKGGENIETDYTYVYLTSLTGKLLFRIKQVDYDGKQSFSQVKMISLLNNADDMPRLYPVPARDYFCIDFKKAISHVYIEILSSDMKLLFAEEVDQVLKEKIIYTNRLTAGTYFVRITTGKNRYVQKLIKL